MVNLPAEQIVMISVQNLEVRSSVAVLRVPRTELTHTHRAIPIRVPAQSQFSLTSQTEKVRLPVTS